MSNQITCAGFWRVFRNPDDLGNSEYRAIYDTIIDSVFDGDVPEPGDDNDPITSGQTDLILGILDEFAEWATALSRRLKDEANGNRLEQAPGPQKR